MTVGEAVPKRRWSVRMRNFRGSLLVAGAEEDDGLELSDAARFMFVAIDGRRTVADIGDLVAAEYDIPLDVAVADVAELVNDLAAAQVVDIIPPDPNEN